MTLLWAAGKAASCALEVGILGFTEDEMDDVAGERRHGLKELPSKKLPDKQQQKAGQMAVVCQTIP